MRGLAIGQNHEPSGRLVSLARSDWRRETETLAPTATDAAIEEQEKESSFMLI